MRRYSVSVLTLALILAVNGCTKKASRPGSKEEPKPATRAKMAAAGPAHAGKGAREKPHGVAPVELPTDVAYSKEYIQAPIVELRTRLEVEGLAPEGQVPDEVKQAQAGSVTTQTLVVSPDRGKMIFTTADFFLPRGTELRYHGGLRKYALVDPAKKIYWAMGGDEIGNLLEGGPSLKRSGYKIETFETKEKASIAGRETRRTNAEIRFDWEVKEKSSQRSGKVLVKLGIWHTDEALFKPAWGRMMIDLFTVPFQDAAGRKVIETLKKKIAFPLKWEMEVVQEGRRGDKTRWDIPPKLISEATSVGLKDTSKLDLAVPPLDGTAARQPYEFGEGGQTAKETLLGKLPARQGEPPRKIEQRGKSEPPESDQAKKQ